MAYTSAREEGLVLAHARHRSLVAFLGAVITLGSLVSISASPASAEPGKLAAVRNHVMDLQAKAESATERYNEAQGRLDDVNATLAVLRSKAARQQTELNAVVWIVHCKSCSPMIQASSCRKLLPLIKLPKRNRLPFVVPKPHGFG